jgi:hypothetical protein
MRYRLSGVWRGTALAVWCAGAFALLAQAPPNLPPTYIPQTKFWSGQDVVPVYEGWLRNADGTFTMVFGYFNRNWREELAIPPGPENFLAPGQADQGQPTFFTPRRQRWVFRVNVPADWGQKELIWTLTAHGRTEKAYGQLLREQEIIERLIMSRGNLSPGLDDPNQPPSIAIEPPGEAAAGRPVALTALVTDDGLPKPPVVKARPAAEPGKAQTNTSATRRYGLSVTWLEYRGPAKVTFDYDDRIPVNEGKAVTTARFTEPGTYQLQATASDGALSTTTAVTVKVVAPAGTAASK